MKIKIEGKTFRETQQWWQNFILDMNDPNKEINSKFAQYGAIMILDTDDDIDFLEFKSEKHYNYFLLKWS